MVEPFANSGDPDHKRHSAASDLGLHCLPITLFGVSRLQWVNKTTQLLKAVFASPKWFIILCSILRPSHPH